MRTLNYPRGMALAVAVLILCVVIELFSGSIRTALLSGGRPVGSGKSIAGFVDKVSAGWVTGGPEAARTGPQRLVPPWDSARIGRFTFIGALLAIVVLSFIGAGFSWEAIGYGLATMPQTLALFFPPGGLDILPMLLGELLVTIQIGLAATLLGAVLAIPIGVLAARNVMPNRSVQTFFRVLIVVVRGIPELILAIIFVVVTGLGSVAGTLALAIGAIGLLSKLIADSLEETDVRVQEALRASGAMHAQVFVAATLRQAAPAFVAHLMYLLDVNIRSASCSASSGRAGSASTCSMPRGSCSSTSSRRSCSSSSPSCSSSRGSRSSSAGPSPDPDHTHPARAGRTAPRDRPVLRAEASCIWAERTLISPDGRPPVAAAALAGRGGATTPTSVHVSFTRGPTASPPSL